MKFMTILAASLLAFHAAGFAQKRPNNKGLYGKAGTYPRMGQGVPQER